MSSSKNIENSLNTELQSEPSITMNHNSFPTTGQNGLIPGSGDANEISEHFSRRQFLKTAGSAALLATLGIVLPGCSDDSNNVIGPDDEQGGIEISGNTIRLNLRSPDVARLGDSGGWLLILPAQTLAVNIDGAQIRAFTSICTHANCDRNWNYVGQQFVCSCHGSRFSNAGRVVQGPATRDLTEFAVSRDGDVVTITKS
jgi:cytochrome b6-f complex iron-sulfur subunit